MGIYFITQSPRDIPDGILGQLGNKIQHALRAYTPTEQKAVRAAADSFRPNPEFDTRQAIGELGIGEALVSFLDREGIPGVVRRARILPPQSLMGPVSGEERQRQMESQPLYSKYGTMVDRDSAYEFFQRKTKQQEELELRRKEEEKAEKEAGKEAERLEKARVREAEQREKAKKRAAAGVVRSAAGTIGREVGNEIGKSVGGSFGRKLGGNIGASIGRGILGTLFGR